MVSTRLRIPASVTVSRKAGGRCCLITVLLPVVVLLAAPVWLGWIGQALEAPVNVHAADAIVILGGNPGRLIYGVDLYRKQLAPKLWYTGDGGIPSMPGSTYGEFARQYAVDHGVPTAAMRLLESTSTWEDGRAIAARAKQEQVQSVLVVTDWYHAERALCAIKQQVRNEPITVYYAQVPTELYGPDNWWQREDGQVAVGNEVIKRLFYWKTYGVPPWGC